MHMYMIHNYLLCLLQKKKNILMKLYKLFIKIIKIKKQHF